jgi:hypothetical protein
MNQQMKINYLQNFLNLSLRSTDSTRAEKNLLMAEKLLQEVESATLANPWLQESVLENLISVTRSPLWAQASSRIQSLRNAEWMAA